MIGGSHFSNYCVGAFIRLAGGANHDVVCATAIGPVGFVFVPAEFGSNVEGKVESFGDQPLIEGMTGIAVVTSGAKVSRFGSSRGANPGKGIAIDDFNPASRWKNRVFETLCHDIHIGFNIDLASASASKSNGRQTNQCHKKQ